MMLVVGLVGSKCWAVVVMVCCFSYVLRLVDCCGNCVKGIVASIVGRRPCAEPCVADVQVR